MSRKICSSLLLSLLAVLCTLPALAQDGAATAYSPYSVYGVGDLYRQGSAYTRTMGGVGVAGRDRRYLNTLNPAAVTARDTLAFMVDFSVVQSNNIYRQGSLRSANNTFNINNFAFSFPIWRKSAMAFGISPYSSVGYDYSRRITDPKVIGMTGPVEYTASGNGGLYQIFGGAAATFWNRLSVGAQAIYYFGNIDRSTSMDFESDAIRSLDSGYILKLNGFTGKFGLQYQQPIKDLYLTLGATYKLGAPVGGYITSYKYGVASTKIDTLVHKVDTLAKSRTARFADEIGVGFSIGKPEKWKFEFNWLRSGWASSGFDATPGLANVGGSATAALPFTAASTNSFRAGFEYIPNRSDIRYYLRRCAYRVGAYYDNAYYKVDGRDVFAYGVTFGVTLPVFRWYNGVTVGMDIGQRGSLTGGMVRETYAMFVVGFSIHDIWFIKPRYE